MAKSPLLGAGYDRPYGDPKLSRSVVMAPNGMLATSHTLAAEAGVDLLKRGATRSTTPSRPTLCSVWWSR